PRGARTPPRPDFAGGARMSTASWWRAGTVLALCASCSDVSRFDTGKDDAYCGTIVSAPFVREGFSRLVQAELHIDTSALNSQPGKLTSHRDDRPCEGKRLFDGAP